ncbi:MAG: hypothetical protein VW258_01020 [Thalassolituus sp.]
MPTRLLLLALVIFSTSLFAAEVDQFTVIVRDGIEHPREALPDSRFVLNAEVNRRLQRAVERANRAQPFRHPPNAARTSRRPHCDITRLYNAVGSFLARPIVGQVETFAEQSPYVARQRILLNESIYHTFTWPQSPSLVLSERVAAVVRIDDDFVGSDKFGHFFSEGRSYFEESQRLTLPLNSALLFGEWTESVYFGAETTGVYSFGDLVANFNGLRFWNALLGHQPDPLTGEGVKQYFSCVDKRWVQTRTFDWREYIDTAWNESINCSMFRTPELLAKILESAPLCRTDELPYSRYGSLGERLFNTMGLAVLPEYLQPEVILRQIDPDLMTQARIEWLKSVRQDLEAWRVRQDEEIKADAATTQAQMKLESEVAQ